MAPWPSCLTAIAPRLALLRVIEMEEVADVLGGEADTLFWCRPCTAEICLGCGGRTDGYSRSSLGTPRRGSYVPCASAHTPVEIGRKRRSPVTAAAAPVGPEHRVLDPDVLCCPFSGRRQPGLTPGCQVALDGAADVSGTKVDRG